MKLALALLAFAACAWGNSLRYYAWSPHKEFVYRFESQVLSGVPGIHATHAAGLRLMANVRVQSFPDYTLRIKFEQPQFKTINGIITNPGAATAGGSELFTHLVKPFEVQLKRGIVEKVIVEAGEPDAVINIKKALLAQIQLDLSAGKPQQQQQSVFSAGAGLGGGLADLSFFSTMEQSLQGECQTEYTVHPLPIYQAQELEGRWFAEAKKINPAITQLEAEVSCRGKPYFQVTKTRNFDNCRQRPVYAQMTGMEFKCDITKANCDQAMTHVSATKYVICGAPEEFFIRKAEAENTILMPAMPWQTEERMKMTARVVVELVRVADMVNEELPRPVTPAERLTLMYDWPVPAGARIAPAEMARQEALTGIRPVMPQPGLTGAPVLLIPTLLTNAQVIDTVKTKVLKLAEEVFKSPESCGCTNDASGHLIAIARATRQLSTAEFQHLEAAIVAAAPNAEVRATAQALVADTLAMVGTNQAIMYIKAKIEAGEITGERAVQVAQLAIGGIRTPTEPLLRAVLATLKGVRATQPHLFHTGLTTLAELVFRAYVHPVSSVTEFPVNIFGRFEQPQSTFVAELVAFCTAELEAMAGQTVPEHRRLVFVAALAKLGHAAALKPLLKVAEGTFTAKPMVRAIAVYGLKRLAILQPSKVKPILLALIDNPAENAEVRIAAVAVLPHCQPSVAELHKIAVRSWFEPSQQVTSFIYSTFVHLAGTEDLALRRLRAAARTILPIMKPMRFGIQFSHNIIADKFVNYLRAVPHTHIRVVSSDKAPIPSKISFKNWVKVWPAIIKGVEFSAYTQGMDYVIDRVMEFLNANLPASPAVAAELQKLDEVLGVKKRAPSTTQPEMHMKLGALGIQRFIGIDAETIGMVKRALADFTLAPAFNYRTAFTKALKAVDFVAAGPCDAGFPVYVEATIPLVVSIKAALRTEGTMEWHAVFGKRLPTKVVADVKALVNGKVQVHAGAVCPFTGTYVAAGVDVNLHASVPLYVEAAYSAKGVVEAKLSTPTDIQGRQELLHFYVKPFTTVMRLSDITPVGRSSGVKEIIAEADPVKKFNIPVGARFGLGFDMTAEIESNSRLIDLQAVYEKLVQHNFWSLHTAFMLPSMRKNSFRIFYNPSTSDTKAIIAKFSFGFAMKKTEGEAVMLTAEPLRAWHSGVYNGASVAPMMKQICNERLMALKKGYAMAMNIEAGFKGAYGFTKKAAATVSIAARMDKEPAKHIIKTLIAGKAEVKEVTGIYTFEMTTGAVIPRIKNWWNVDRLLAEPLKVTVESHTRFGMQGSATPRFELHALTTAAKCEAHKTAVANSAEFARCTADEAAGRKFTTDCMRVRHMASALDDFQVALTFAPDATLRHPIFRRFEEFVKACFLPYINFRQLPTPVAAGKVLVEAGFSHTSEVANLRWAYGRQRVEATNIRMPRFFKNLIPISARHNIIDIFAEKFTGNAFPASCRVDRGFIATFDNLVYPYTMNGCEHLLLKDCSGKIPLAVTAMKTIAGETRVKILAGTVRAELVGSAAAGVAKVTVNGAAQTIATGQIVAIRNAAGAAVIELQKFADGVVTARLPWHMPAGNFWAPLFIRLEVFFNGEHAEIVGPAMIRNRMCGICGDLNMEKTADLKSPGECVFSKRDFAIASYQVPTATGTCPAIPAAEKAVYQREATQCVRKTEVLTPLSRLLALVNDMFTTIMNKHRVIIFGNTACISKSALAVCAQNNIPAEVRQRSIAFTCMAKNQAGAAELISRARAGVQLARELAGRPTHQRMMELEPIACKGPDGVVNFMQRVPRV